MRPVERLRKEIEEKANQSEVGRRCKPPVTPTAVGRWLRKFDAGMLTDESWADFAVGLSAVGIEPERYRPVIKKTRAEVHPEIVPLIDRFVRREHLEALRDLLKKEEAHQFALVIISERLKHT